MLRLIEFKLSKLMVLNKSTMKFGQYSCSNTFSTDIVRKIPNSEEERILRPPTGTRDFDPDSHRFRTWMHGKWKTVAERFGFLEYDAPTVEFEELYKRKSGEDVSKQMYTLQDKDGQLLSLRPEMTPSLARMILARKDTLALPLKWFSVPQCWRYETTTVGRRREHYQWNMDVWGVAGVEAEAELLSSAVAALTSMGLTHRDVVFKINSRKIINGLMKLLDIPEAQWTATFLLMDKLEKLPLDALQGEMREIGLERAVVEDLLASLQIKDISHFASKLGPASEGVSDVVRLLELLELYGLSEWVQFDASVVRGLAYYSGVVFETFDRQGQFRAICGGGRYDNLLTSMFRAEAIPAVGFGFGDAVVEELLRSRNLLPSAESLAPGVDVLLYSMDKALRPKAVELANTLRAAGVTVDYIFEDGWKPKHAFQRGDKVRAKYCLMLAGSEHKNGEAVLKNLRARSQCTFKYEDLGVQIAEILQTK